MMRLGLMFAFTALLVPARADAGACAQPTINPMALTVADTELAKGGGVVVMVEDAAKGAPASWKFFNGKDLVAPQTRAIGAGLVVLSPPRPGDWSLEDRKAKVNVIVKVKAAATDPKLLDAPKVKSIKRMSGSGRRGNWSNVSVEVAGPAPAGAVALVVSDGKSTRSFARVDGVPQPEKGKNAVYVVFYSGSCTVMPNATVESQVGDKVAIAWLDGSGRMSPATAATVALAPVPKQSGPSDE